MNKNCHNCYENKPYSDYREITEKRTKTPKTYLCSICKACERLKSLERYNKNRDSNIAKNKEYKNSNKDKVNETRRKYTKEKMKIPQERLKRNMKSLISSKMKKTRHTGEYLGTSMSEIVRWIEYNFEDGMDWSNYGSIWEIDHVMPISSFDLSDDLQTLLCFSWMNLRPKDSSKNRSKSSKVIFSDIFLQEMRLRSFANNNPNLNMEIKKFLIDYSNHFSICNTPKLREPP